MKKFLDTVLLLLVVAIVIIVINQISTKKITSSSPPAKTEQFFHGLGFLNNGGYSKPTDISGDGNTVVGEADGEAFIWNEVNGIQGLDIPKKRSFVSYATSVSAKGNTIVGINRHYKYGNECYEGFIWDKINGIRTLGSLDGRGIETGKFISQANVISADGLLVGGVSSSNNGYEAFIWDETNGMQGLGDLDQNRRFHSQIQGISLDASILTGTGSSEKGFEAFIWDEIYGMQKLGHLGKGNRLDSRAFDISADGSTVIGTDLSNSKQEAFIWNETKGMQGLGSLKNDESLAKSVSADGSIVVGTSFGGRKENGKKSSYEAFVWDKVHGIRALKTVLENEYNLDLANWYLLRANGISDDGLTIVGEGINPKRQREGWIVKLPSYSF